MKTTLLKGIDITKSFSKSGVGTQVLDHINVEIFEGDFTVIMGASGAGKSTLLYALSGMDSITSGTIEYRNKKLSGLKEIDMASLRAKEFGFVFQQAHLVSNLSLFENIAVAGYVGGKQKAKGIDIRVEDLLTQMHIFEARNRLPMQTSGGEAQRAAIARAIINSPSLIFADEPTGALNKRNREEVLNILSELHENGQSILMVTHDIRAAIRGTRLLYMEDGKILDELSLPPYEEENIRERESQVNSWLSSLQW